MLLPCTNEPYRTLAKPPLATSLSATRTALNKTGLFLQLLPLLLAPPPALPPPRRLLQHRRTFLDNAKQRLEAIRGTARGVCQDARIAHMFRSAFIARSSRSTTMTVSAGNMVETTSQTRLQISCAHRNKGAQILVVYEIHLCIFGSLDFLLFKIQRNRLSWTVSIKFHSKASEVKANGTQCYR
jgi:hypothetical protein